MNQTEKNILNLIRIHNKLSNTEITKITGKHKSTISPCINTLLNEGYIVTAGTGSSTKKGGKPPLYLEINSKKLYVIGLSIEPEKLTAIVTDFSGNIVATHWENYSDKDSTEAVLLDIKNIIQRIIKKETVKEDKIAGIGIGISAQVDSNTGVIYNCEGIKLTKVPLKEEISKLFPYPIQVINDVNASLLAEKWFVMDSNSDARCDNFMYLFIGSTLKNMGLGLYLNNQLYEGSNHHAGEMYYYLSDKRLEKTLPTDEDLSDFTIDRVKEFLASDHETVKQLLDIYIDIISEKMIHSIELLNPEKLIIGGNVIYAEDEFLNPLINSIKSKTEDFFEDFLQIDITKSSLDELAAPLGATTLILNSYFK